MQEPLQKSLAIRDQIHSRALEVAGRYVKAEADLIDVLQQVEQHRVFLAQGYSSLFAYCVGSLGLSESVTCNLIAVSRKAREVPELKAEIASGAITLSNARKIVPVLTPENKSEWLQKASEMSQRQLEKEVVKVRPQEAVPERVSYVTETRVKLETGMFERDMKTVRRVQDLLSQARRRPVSLEEAIVAVFEDYQKRNDPLEKAKRHYVKKGFSGPVVVAANGRKEGDGSGAAKHLKEGDAKDSGVQNPPVSVKASVSLTVSSEPGRERIPAALEHQVNLRDEMRCTNVNQKGERCRETR